MSRRFLPRSSSAENVDIIVRSLPWKTIIGFVICAVGFLPFLACSLFIANNGLLDLSQLFSAINGAHADLPPPHTSFPFPAVSPQMGVIPYVIQDGDSCNEILANQMNMGQSTKIFNDAQKNSIQVLNRVLGQNCQNLTVGAVIPLQPQSPLVAIGGIVRKISTPSFVKPTPTPLVRLPKTIRQQAEANRYVDCSGGCNLQIQTTSKDTANLFVETDMHVQVGSWVWALAMMQPQKVPGLDNYPYLEPHASVDKTVLRACDFTLEDQQDDNMTPCRKLLPNTIDDDGGIWLYAVTGSQALGHWHWASNLPPNTQVLMWLSSKGGDLQYEDNNPIYRYSPKQHAYIKLKKTS